MTKANLEKPDIAIIIEKIKVRKSLLFQITIFQTRNKNH